MKIVVTGSLGHISLPLTKELIQNGHTVTVISSKEEKQTEIEALGAKAAIGTIKDADFLTTSFKDADAVYTMIPPPQVFDQNLDYMAECKHIANNYFQAIQRASVKRVVHLSSIGAHMDKNSGIILCHHAVEGILNNLSEVAITFMRPSAFYYNLNSFIEMIKHSGMIASNYGGEDKVSWVSPLDIAAAIYEEITTPLQGKKVRYVASEELTCNEVATILGEAIGKLDLKWVTISNEQLLSALESFGMNKILAAGFVEMNASIHSGEFFYDYNNNKPVVMGKVKMKEYAKEFASLYNQK